jgi:hypothetical protein
MRLTVRSTQHSVHGQAAPTGSTATGIPTLAERNSRLQPASDVDASAAVVKPVLQFVKVVVSFKPPADQLPVGAGRQEEP